MRKLFISAALGAIIGSSAMAFAQPAPPAMTVTTDHVDCQPIDYGDVLAHSTAVLACVDARDGIDFRLHQLGPDTWLEVMPS